MIETLWSSGTPSAIAARALLWPAELAFRAAVRARNALYDAGVFASWESELPCVSVGNLSVGGTGKTPVAAWLAGRLAERGAAPAVVLRGYGADEPLVHRRLNPGIPVVVSPDRLAGVAAAHAAGATVAVLDDAFQHRRVRRAVDLVLVSADRWSAHRRRLPAGPWRESLGALRRASMALVTVKAAEADAVDAALRAIAEAAPELPVGVARLALGEVGSVAGPPGAGRSTALDDLRGTNVLVVAAIADPAAFVRQLESAGATVRGTRKRYGDHHAFTDAEVTSLAAEATGTDAVVCTLKDAVKLEGRWPRGAPPLRFVSQRVIIERGQEAVDHLLMRVILSPPESHDAAGPDRPPLR